MSFLLDTDICSAQLRGRRKVFSKFVQHSGQLHVSAVAVGELYSWVLRSKAPAWEGERFGWARDWHFPLLFALNAATDAPAGLAPAERRIRHYNARLPLFLHASARPAGPGGGSGRKKSSRRAAE